MTAAAAHTGPPIARIAAGLRDLVNSTGLVGGPVADDGWLTIGEVVARIRAAGYPDSESTVRRMVDDGELGEVYRSRGGHRNVKPAGVEALICRRRSQQPPAGDGDQDHEHEHPAGPAGTT